MEVTLPDKLKPKESEDLIQVKVKGPPFKTHIRDLSRACKAAGLTFMSQARIKEIQAAGIAMEGIGTQQLSGGGMFITQQCLIFAMAELTQMMKKERDPETKRLLAQPIGYLAGKMTGAHKEITAKHKGDDVAPPSQSGKQYVTFQPGAVVQNHYHEKPPEKVVK